MKMGQKKKVTTKLDFIKEVFKVHIREIIAFFRHLFPSYEFFHHWEISSKDEMIEVVRVYKYWLGVELEQREYVLKDNSIDPEKQKEIIRQHMQTVKRMYDELPPELQKEISG